VQQPGGVIPLPDVASGSAKGISQGTALLHKIVPVTNTLLF